MEERKKTGEMPEENVEKEAAEAPGPEAAKEETAEGTPDAPPGQYAAALLYFYYEKKWLSRLPFQCTAAPLPAPCIANEMAGP